MISPRARLIVTVALAFGLGVVCGQWASRSHRWRRWDPQKRHEHLTALFSRKLNLTTEQQAEVGRILEGSHLRMRSLHDQVRPQFEALRAETSQQIRAVLTPKQIDKFDEMERAFKARWASRRGRWRGMTDGTASPDASRTEPQQEGAQ